MPTAIIEPVAGDKAVELTNSSGARTLLIGTSWTSIRLGVLCHWSDLGSNPGSSPRAYIGALSGKVAANHVLKSTTTNWIGALPGQTTWTRNAGPPVYYAGSVNPTPACKKVGATLTIGSTGSSVPHFSAAATARNIFLVEIVKGSPNWTVNYVFPNAAAGAQADKTTTILRAALEASTMANAAAAIGANYTTGSAVAIAFDETAGSIDTFHIAWDKTVFTWKVHAIGYSKIS